MGEPCGEEVLHLWCGPKAEGPTGRSPRSEGQVRYLWVPGTPGWKPGTETVYEKEWCVRVWTVVVAPSACGDPTGSGRYQFEKRQEFLDCVIDSWMIHSPGHEPTLNHYVLSPASDGSTFGSVGTPVQSVVPPLFDCS